jgi:hypothetical protein
MERRIAITAGPVTAEARLDASGTADAVWRALPIEAKADTWGDEIYFGIGVAIPEESPREIVEVGELAYWPPGRAFCIFFGPTPASQGEECRAASPVNVFGRLTGDPGAFRAVRSGARVRIERSLGRAEGGR